MNQSDPVIAIIGAGAVGSYYGARLAQHGNDVHFLLRSDYEAIQANGMKIQSCAGDFSLSPRQLNLYRNVSDMPKADWVIVTLKSTSNGLFEPLIGPLLKSTTAILTLQNGLGNEDALAQLFGPERVLGGMAFTCINRLEPGVIDHSAHGLIRMGEWIGAPSERARSMAMRFVKSNVPCEVLPSLIYGRWEKLLWNIPFNGLSTVLNSDTEAILSTEHGRALVVKIMREVICAAATDGVKLPRSLIQVNLDRTREMGKYLTSMQIDRRMGRGLEVETILGEPFRRAISRNAATPCMEMLYQLTKMISTSLESQ